MRRWKTAFVVSALGLASMQAFACYTVYDPGNRIVYQSDKPPVDMSLPLHETLAKRFPGGSMVFDESAFCPATINSLAMGDGGRVTATTSPLLTDEATARALGVPHRSVGRNVAVVPAHSAAMETGVTVVPAASVGAKSRGRQTVITEYRSPPVTIVRRGDEVILSEVR